MAAPKGHNSGPIIADRLKSFVDRIEKLEEERVAIGGDIKDVYSEAKGVGYDVGTMRKVVRLRGMDAADRAEQQTLLDVYWHALEQPDRIDARLEAGESQREIAKAEGVSKSTVQRRGPKTTRETQSTEMDHPAEGRDAPSDEHSESEFSAALGDEPLEAIKAGLRAGTGDGIRTADTLATHSESCGGRGYQDNPAPHGLEPPEKGLATPNTLPPLPLGGTGDGRDVGNVVMPEPERVCTPLPVPPQDIDTTLPAFLDRRQQARA